MSPPEYTEPIYMLNAGSAQSEHDRLNAQHRLCDDILRNELLPPHIASSLSALPTPPKILEIATGTAVWLSAVAETLPPDAELVGLDFDTSKFPTPSSLAPNIELRQANMFEPFSSDLLGKFDIVNVRLIIFALKDGLGTNLVKNLMTLLKPGGHVVWTETGPGIKCPFKYQKEVIPQHLENFHYSSPISYTYTLQAVTSIEPPSLAWFKFQEISWDYASKVGRDTNLPIGMIHYLKEAGCVDCDDRAYPSSSQLYTDKKDWTERMNTQAKLLAAQALRGIVSLGGVEGMTTESEAEELIASIHKEITGRKIHYLFMRAWGKKPGAC